MVKLSAWEHFHLDPRRMLAFCLSCSLSAGVAVRMITANVLGTDSLPLSGIVSAIVFYLALSFPKRLVESAALAQSREAPALAVMGSATLEATHSRTKAVLLLSSGNDDVSSVLLEARKRILRGYPANVAIGGIDGLASSSTAEVLRSIASAERPQISEGGEESQGIVQSSQMAEESKLPIFIAVAFFAPIMLLLYAIMSHVGEAAGLAEVVALQVVLLDIAYYFSSSDRRRLL